MNLNYFVKSGWIIMIPASVQQLFKNIHLLLWLCVCLYVCVNDYVFLHVHNIKQATSNLLLKSTTLKNDETFLKVFLSLLLAYLCVCVRNKYVYWIPTPLCTTLHLFQSSNLMCRPLTQPMNFSLNYYYHIVFLFIDKIFIIIAKWKNVKNNWMDENSLGFPQGNTSLPSLPALKVRPLKKTVKPNNKQQNK